MFGCFPLKSASSPSGPCHSFLLWAAGPWRFAGACGTEGAVRAGWDQPHPSVAPAVLRRLNEEMHSARHMVKSQFTSAVLIVTV